MRSWQGVEGRHCDRWEHRGAGERLVRLLDDFRRGRLDKVVEAATAKPCEDTEQRDDQKLLHGSLVTLCFSITITLDVAFTT
jgi:hypothetical protein